MEVLFIWLEVYGCILSENIYWFCNISFIYLCIYYAVSFSRLALRVCREIDVRRSPALHSLHSYHVLQLLLKNLHHPWGPMWRWENIYLGWILLRLSPIYSSNLFRRIFFHFLRSSLILTFFSIRSTWSSLLTLCRK